MSPVFLKKLNRALWLGLAIVLVAATAAYGAMLLLVRSKEKQIEDRWAGSYGSMAGFAARFPAKSKNVAAEQIENLCVPLGLPFLSLSNKNDIQNIEPGDWSKVTGYFHKYLEKELNDPAVCISPPPEEAGAFLESHGGVLSSVKAVLRNEGPPIWDVDLSGGGRRPPNHLGILSLGEWLFVDAMARFANHDSAGGLGDLEATWVLEKGLLSRPELVFFGSAVAMARERAGVLRKSGLAPPEWQARLDPAPYEKEFMSALQFEAWKYWNAGQMTAMAPYASRAARREGWLWKSFGRLWFRLSMADAGIACLDQIAILERQGWCNSSMAAGADFIARDLPEWSASGHFGVTRMSIPWTSVTQLELDLELTQKLFIARQARSASERWPPAIPGIEKSRCPGTRWFYAVNQDGGMTLAYSGSAAREKRDGRIDLPMMVIERGGSQ
ncbi:MAG: hypothetical protein JHC34_04415 [Acidobacteria bacterium]|nr:hypothetical protein [Acidobacteriota bacterium]